MDYEKKYKEALALARSYYDKDSMNAFLDTIFPELAESEDEKMRKAALEGIEYLERKLGWDAIGDTDILDVKEYLEKQKESNIDKLRKISTPADENWFEIQKQWEKQDEDERIRKGLLDIFKQSQNGYWAGMEIKDILAWLEKQKEEEGCEAIPVESTLEYKLGFKAGKESEKQKDASKAIEAVDRIDKYIDENLANAHDMKDSDPDKKYYLGWDDALGKMAGILQDVYSGEKQKEQKNVDTQDLPCWKRMIGACGSGDDFVKPFLIRYGNGVYVQTNCVGPNDVYIDLEELEKLPMPNDVIDGNLSITQKEQQKAKMLEGAVGKYVHELYTDEEGYHGYISLGTEYAPGDKVRVIVIKED